MEETTKSVQDRKFERYVEAPLVELVDRFNVAGLPEGEFTKLLRLAKKVARRYGVDETDVIEGRVL